MNNFVMPKIPKHSAPVLPPPPVTRTDFAIIVQERTDGRIALYVKVTRRAERVREEKSVFAITDRIDARLESYLRELSDAERARRLNEPRLTRRSTKKQIVDWGVNPQMEIRFV